MTFIVPHGDQPAAACCKRIENIAKGDLTMPDDVAGRSEIGRLTRDLQTMQHSLVTTVGTVRQGAEEIYRGTSEISAGNTDSLHAPSSRPPPLSRRQPAWNS
jgi:methyl-accepting chemotaxis protein-3 (ribose and galactose sensor receptor)